MVVSPRPVVAVDAMGGDLAPGALVEGAVLAHEAGLGVILVGHEAELRPLLPASSGVQIVHAADVVGMDAKPGDAKRLDDASVRVALRLVAEGRACGAVSAGNSGATLFAAVLELGRVEGVDRPAIATSLPRSDGGTLVLVDIGTTTDAQPHHLASFALLGEAYARVLGMDAPRVGLLSNGSEPGKGNRLVQESAPLIEALPLDFVGNVEPDAAFAGACDVLVSDGFTGNILLKTAEGVIGMLRRVAGDAIRGDLRGRLAGLLLRPAARALRDELDWRSRGGALLLGVPAPVVVAHGRADPVAVRAAIQLAHYAHGHGLVGAVARGLAARPGPG
ncbi:MAG: phosphate acyltransferase PlsX [Alphaproteobacteria bacterium]|nr:phosphate acyltransferase PlsX [Alphaproteobacteria bacterium]